MLGTTPVELTVAADQPSKPLVTRMFVGQRAAAAKDVLSFGVEKENKGKQKSNKIRVLVMEKQNSDLHFENEKGQQTRTKQRQKYN